MTGKDKLSDSKKPGVPSGIDEDAEHNVIQRLLEVQDSMLNELKGMVDHDHEKIINLELQVGAVKGLISVLEKESRDDDCKIRETQSNMSQLMDRRAEAIEADMKALELKLQHQLDDVRDVLKAVDATKAAEQIQKYQAIVNEKAGKVNLAVQKYDSELTSYGKRIAEIERKVGVLMDRN